MLTFSWGIFPGGKGLGIGIRVRIFQSNNFSFENIISMKEPLDTPVLFKSDQKLNLEKKSFFKRK